MSSWKRGFKAVLGDSVNDRRDTQGMFDRGGEIFEQRLNAVSVPFITDQSTQLDMSSRQSFRQRRDS